MWPPRLRAQRPIKLIAYFAPARTQHLVDAFNKGLRDFGYVEGRNITVQYRFADEQGTALDAVAAQVVELAPDVIVVVGVAAASSSQARNNGHPGCFRSGRRSREERPGGSALAPRAAI